MQEIKKNIYWLGLKDWELREFHGHELSTHRGSSYNSYFIKDKKNVLIDTVWYPHKDEFDAILEKDIGGIENIDMIVINHSEPDHAGCLGHIMSKKPDIPIYCTKHGADILKKHFHKDWNFNIVKTGDTVNIGEYDLVFVEMRMIHWPDSMMTYVKGANLVFSNDAFGQHYSAAGLYNDEVDNCELYQEAIKYYANILTPMSGLIKKKVEEVRALNLPIDVIAPSHGVLWRDNPVQIIDKYYEWANEYHENSVVIIYDTMYDATKKMAEAIGEGLSRNNIKYKLFNSAISDGSDLITEIFKAKGVIVGSCTVNNTVLSSIAAMLEEIKAHKYKGKIGAGFGSYGWSGESPKIITKALQDAGVKVVLEPIKVEYQPTEDDIKKAIEFGDNFAKHMG
ncbi:flavodoxin domain-containing protein [Pseudobacteroides cellulosolvens]|uniref:Beta-lactamase domain protein n=1 Tax=Pseudobacteroides cellulosolvens ATCC 35603 = DSM 2933 TaxID=398512 RepID=A0A0L6JP47_9FIRM|nr:flavodoxin domain-containing protein [Pseudobacteroides cellulosolvens]KNY27137.1 beta-lactamase domain protein [Pseudobacteroides cellulosolvens ATCC 35603 = DSM 2933]